MQSQREALVTIRAITRLNRSRSLSFIATPVLFRDRTSSKHDCTSHRKRNIFSALTTASSDEFYMRKALQQASTAFRKNEVPIGAVLVATSGDLIASGHNLVEFCNDCTRHAEMVCLQEAMKRRKAWRLQGTTLFTTLEPCPMCISALALSRVSRVVYGAKDLRLGACGTWVDLVCKKHPFHTFDQVVGGVLEEESARLLRDFFRERRRKSPPKPPL